MAGGVDLHEPRPPGAATRQPAAASKSCGDLAPESPADVASAARQSGAVARPAAVADIMGTEFASIDAKATVGDAITRLVEERSEILFVLAADGQLLGCAPLSRLARADRAGLALSSVLEIAQMPALILGPDDGALRAGALVGEAASREHLIPVLARGRLVGVVAASDLLRLYAPARH